MSPSTSLELRLRCVQPGGPVGYAARLCGAAAACLRTAHLLPDGTGTWSLTPRPADAPPLHEEATDATLELKPGVTVRQVFSAPSLVESGTEAQTYRFTAVGWPGARLVLEGDTFTVDARGTLHADNDRAAVMMWKALLPALRDAGWRDLTLADPVGGPALEAAANAGGVPLPLKHLRDTLHADLAKYVERWAWKEGRLDLAQLFSRPLAATAMDALLCALPTSELKLPYGGHSPLPSDVQLLSRLQRLEGAFTQLPPPGALARLEHLAFYGLLPTNLAEYPWDELAALRRLDLHDVELDAFPAALALSPTLRELRLSARSPLRLEGTSSYGPLRLERLELGRVPVPDLPSAATLQHLVLRGCDLPFGALPPLPALRTLALSSCQWSSLPAGLGQMQQLESLSVQDCPLTTLDALPPLPALKQLTLHRANLATFPEVLQSLPALEHLEASWAGPGMGEAELRARLPQLKHLHVTGS